MTTQQIAGFKAAYTRKIKEIEQQAADGSLSTAQAAGFKAAAKRKLNEQISA